MARSSTVGHITPAAVAPQRPDATADGGGACTGPKATVLAAQQFSGSRRLFDDLVGERQPMKPRPPIHRAAGATRQDRAISELAGDMVTVKADKGLDV